MRLSNNEIIYEGNKVVEKIEGNTKGDELMRKMEYDLANELSDKVDLIFMDRKLTMDKELGILFRGNIIGIIKDFDRSKINVEINKPWMMIEAQGEITTGYFKFFNWIFRFETTLSDIDYIFNVMYSLAFKPTPEALGYNYALFLADKLVKYYRDKYAKTLDFIASKKIGKYRNFRRIVENGRSSI